MTSKNILMAAAGGASESYWINQIYSSSTERNTIGIVYDSFGNRYTCFRVDSTVYIIKINSLNSIVWSKSLSNISFVSQIILSNDQNSIYISFEFLDSYAGILKLSTSNATVQASKKYIIYVSSILRTTASKLLQDTSGNVFVMGTFEKNSTPTLGTYAIKFNSSLVMQWQETTSENIAFRDSVFDASGNIEILGQVIGSQSYRFKINPDSPSIPVAGEIYSFSDESNMIRNITKDISNNSYIAYLDNVYPNTYAGVSKINSTFTSVVWSKYLNKAVLSFMDESTYPSEFQDIKTLVDTQGNVYISTIHAYYDFSVQLKFITVIYKLNSSGVLQWQRYLRRTDTNILRLRLSSVDSNSIYLSGFDNISSSSSIIKLPSDGTKTGTYSSFIYTPYTGTLSNTTYNFTTSSVSFANHTYAEATYTPTLSDQTVTSTLTLLP